MLVFQQIEKNDIHIFTRDLSEKVNINLKHMIEDFDKSEENNQIKNDKKNNKKKIVLKKKDIIIAEQNKKRKEINMKDDEKRIEYFKNNRKININDVYEFLTTLKTSESKLDFKFYMLKYSWEQKKKNMEYILGLYFQLNGKETKEDHIIIINPIKKKIEGYQYNLYMLKHLGHILPPLNFWEQEFKFDDWQKQALHIIKQKKSLVIKSPTSSGKSFMACSAAVFHKKILYVCPSSAVAYQVGSHFVKMNYRVHFLLENIGHLDFNDKCNIFIGTPEYIEDYLYKIGTDFDYAVYDEIHEMDDHYENIIKLVKCNFLALSATINNIDDIVTFFKNINPMKHIEKIEYNKRFINSQKWIWDNNILKKIHPLHCYNSEDLNDDFINIDFKMTPNDIALLWERLEEVFEDLENDESFDIHESIEDFIESLSPDSYFKNNDKLLTLNNANDYEIFLLKNIIYLNKFYKREISILFNKLKTKECNDKSDPDDIISFLDSCKRKSMFPMLIFNTDDTNCENVFNDIYYKLLKLETDNYPYHYDILEKKQSIYLDYKEKRKIFSDHIKPPKKSNPQEYINSKLDTFDRESKNKFITDMIEYYNLLIDKIDKRDIDDILKDTQTDNLHNDLNKFINSPDFSYQDVFKKHHKYCYNISEPMSGNKIREIRKKISIALGINIEYEHPIFQMLKRGIGLYIEKSPEEYKWILQTLLINKEIGIVVSGTELSTGIDMPIKSACLMGFKGDEFTPSDYLQMSGRAGRRGHDTSGNIIFYSVNYSKLIKSGLPKITGSINPLYNHYDSLQKINYKIKVEDVYKNNFNKNRRVIDTKSIINIDYEKNIYLIIWNLRNYESYHKLLDKLNHSEYESIVNLYDKEFYIFQSICELLDDKDVIISDFKLNKYNIYFKDIINIVMIYYNNLSKDNDKLIPLNNLYLKLKRMIIKNNGFQE